MTIRSADIGNANLEYLEVLHRLTLDLAGQRNPQSVLHRAIHSALTLCGGDSAALYLKLPSGQLELRYAVGATVHEIGFRLEQGEGVTGAVVESGSALLVGDYLAFAGRSPRYGSRQRSIICAPLHSDNTVIGAITLIAEERTDAYSNSDLRGLEHFAALSSVMLGQANLDHKLAREHLLALKLAERRKSVQRVTAQALLEQNPLVALRALMSGYAQVFACIGGLCFVRDQQMLEFWEDSLQPAKSHLRTKRGVVGHVISSGEPLLVGDYAAWPHAIANYAAAGVKSVIATPLKRAGLVIGAIYLTSYTERDYFTDEDLDMLTQASIMAQAILEQARLHDLSEADRQLAQKKNLLLNAIYEINLELNQQRNLNALLLLLLERSLELLDVDAGGIYMIEENQIKLMAALGDEMLPVAPLGFGVSGSVAQSGASMRLADYLSSPFHSDLHPGVSWRSVMSVPLRGAQARVIGVLTVVSTTEANRFNEESLETLERFAALASLAIENTALLQATAVAASTAERKGELLDAMSKVSLELVAHEDAQDLLQKLTQRTIELFNADAAVVYLLDEERTQYQRIAWHGTSPSEAGVIGHGLSGHAMAFEQPLRVADYAVWEGRDVGMNEISVWRGAMSAPLKRGAVIIGALTIASITQTDCFTSTDLETLERFAVLTSLTLEKANLLNSTRKAQHAALGRLAQLEAIDAVSLQLLEQRQPAEVLQRLLRLLMPMVGATGGGYWRYHRDQRVLELTQVEGTAQELLGFKQTADEGVISGILRTAQALVIDDYQVSEQRNRRLPNEHRSVMLTPLTSDDRVIGVLVLTHTSPNVFTTADLETTKRFAALASIALENARLLEGMRKAQASASDRNALLETLHQVNLELGSYVRLGPLLLSILERSMMMLGGHDGRLYLLDESGQTLHLAAHIGSQPIEKLQLGQGVSGQTALTGHSLTLEDYQNYPQRFPDTPQRRWRSVISVPLKRGSQMLGSLTVVDIQQAGRFTPSDLEVLERFAATASLALEKAKLLEEARNAQEATQQRAAQLEALHHASVELSGHLEPQRLLEDILIRAAQFINADAGGIFLNDPVVEQTVLAAQLGHSMTAQMPLGTGASGRVALTGEALLLEDYQIWPGRLEHSDTMARALVSVPLRRAGKVVGALTVADTSTPNRFTALDLEVLQRFAALASVALENARLYALERQNLSDERVRMAITQKISTLRSVKDTAQALVQVLADTLEYEYLAIYRFNPAGLTLQAKIGDYQPPAQLSPQQGVTGRVIRNARAELVVDGSSDPDWISFSKHLTSIVCVPLMGRDGVIGTLSVEGRTDKPLTPADLEMLGALVPAFSTALENATLHEQLELLRLEAVHAARHDPLTGLRNRRAFEEDLAVILEQWRTVGQGFSLAVIDLAGFKAINDSLGHAAGDDALRRIANVLSGASTGTHRAYRIGGDEFLLLIPDPLEPLPLLRDLSTQIQQLEFKSDLRVMPNIGVASCPSDTTDPDRLQSLADKQMYAAKAAGQSMLSSEAPPAPRRRASDPKNP